MRRVLSNTAILLVACLLAAQPWVPAHAGKNKARRREAGRILEQLVGDQSLISKRRLHGVLSTLGARHQLPKPKDDKEVIIWLIARPKVERQKDLNAHGEWVKQRYADSSGRELLSKLRALARALHVPLDPELRIKPDAGEQQRMLDELLGRSQVAVDGPLRALMEKYLVTGTWTSDHRRRTLRHLTRFWASGEDRVPADEIAVATAFIALDRTVADALIRGLTATLAAKGRRKLVKEGGDLRALYRLAAERGLAGSPPPERPHLPDLEHPDAKEIDATAVIRLAEERRAAREFRALLKSLEYFQQFQEGGGSDEVAQEPDETLDAFLRLSPEQASEQLTGFCRWLVETKHMRPTSAAQRANQIGRSLAGLARELNMVGWELATVRGESSAYYRQKIEDYLAERGQTPDDVYSLIRETVEKQSLVKGSRWLTALDKLRAALPTLAVDGLGVRSRLTRATNVPELVDGLLRVRASMVEAVFAAYVDRETEHGADTTRHQHLNILRDALTQLGAEARERIFHLGIAHESFSIRLLPQRQNPKVDRIMLALDADDGTPPDIAARMHSALDGRGWDAVRKRWGAYGGFRDFVAGEANLTEKQSITRLVADLSLLEKYERHVRKTLAEGTASAYVGYLRELLRPQELAGGDQSEGRSP